MILQWFDFIALIIQVVILSTIYSSIILLILLFVSKRTKNIWLLKRMNYKLRNWLLLHLIISIFLFNYSFSYWQDTGLGENPSLPIGYGQRIYSPDFASTNFFPDLDNTEQNKDELVIGNFIIKDNILCAEISHQYSNSPIYDFIVCDLANRKSETFLTETDYNEHAKTMGLPKKNEFYDFKKHFKEYFDNQPTWRKWLLP